MNSLDNLVNRSINKYFNVSQIKFSFNILKLTENVEIETKHFIQGNDNAVFVSITTGNCHRINSV